MKKDKQPSCDKILRDRVKIWTVERQNDYLDSLKKLAKKSFQQLKLSILKKKKKNRFWPTILL